MGGIDCLNQNIATYSHEVRNGGGQSSVTV